MLNFVTVDVADTLYYLPPFLGPRGFFFFPLDALPLGGTAENFVFNPPCAIILHVVCPPRLPFRRSKVVNGRSFRNLRSKFSFVKVKGCDRWSSLCKAH